MTIQENVPLAQHTTLGVGGPARWFAHVTSESELLEAVQFSRDRNLQLFVLGGGSNLLVADAGYAGLVLQLAILGQVDANLRQDVAAAVFDVPAGHEWDPFVEMVCEAGFTGIECLAGIPGLVGGTPVQNVGAYGQEVAQTITSVRVFDLETLEFRSLSAAQCEFGYRRSLFNSTQSGRFIVTRVAFEFALGSSPALTYADLVKHFAGKPAPTPLQISEAVRTIRHRKGMLLVRGDADVQSAGSFFKNPVVDEAAIARVASALGIPTADVLHWPAGEGRVKLPAAWLIERAGFHKGFRMGQAGISTKHTLALVNLGGATTSEIIALRDAVMHKVEERFAIRLEQEPVMLGFTPQD